MKTTPAIIGLILAGTRHFAILACRGGGLVRPPRVWPLINLELRDKNERVGRDKRKPTISGFNGFGH